MKKICYIFIFALTVLTFNTMNVSALGVDLGPFSFRLPIGVDVGGPFYRFYHDPICKAIHQRDLIVMFIETDDKEIEKVVVEPYAFGFGKDGQLVLHGYHIEQVSFENGDESEGSGEGFIGGIFSSFKSTEGWKDFSVNRVVEVRVIDNSDFKVREDALKNMQENNQIVDMICEI